MNKLVKTFSILFATGFMTLTGCNTNDSSNSSEKLIEVPPSYGEKINEADYRDGGFISNYSHVLDYRDNNECLVFSTKESVDEYAASLEANEKDYSYTLEFFNGIDASIFNDYYLIVTSEMMRPNPAYYYNFDGLFFRNPRFTLRFIYGKEEDVIVTEVVVFQFYKVFVSKRHQISVADIDVYRNLI